MTRILVSGANGYIGRHVVARLADLGAEVIAIDIHKSGESPAVAEIEANILSDGFSIADYLDEMPNACLHLAWRNGFNHRHPSHMEDLSGHYRFLRGLAEAGVSRIAAMGTMHEIGYWEGAIEEDTPCNPQSLYAISKDALRRSLFSLEGEMGTKVQWMRGYYIYGDDAASQSIFGKILRASQEGQRTFPFTSGKNLYDFIHVDTLADQIAHVVMQDEVCGIINCCTGNPRSLADAVESFIADRGLDIELEYGAYPDRPYDSPGVWGDASKIQMIMGNDA